MAMKFLIHFHGAQTLAEQSAKVAVRFALAAVVIFLAAAVIAFLTEGVSGVVKYAAEEVDYVGIIKVTLSFYLAILLLLLLFRAAVRFAASISYCKMQGIGLSTLYHMTDAEILSIWGED